MPRKAQKMIEPIPVPMDTLTAKVFSRLRTVQAPELDLPKELKPNERLKMDGIDFLKPLPDAAIPVAFLDPQYRGVLDKLGYGNEGEKRGRRRVELQQMDDEKIGEFILGINRVLIPSGHLFLWVDKYHLMQGFKHWLEDTLLDVVDMVVWDKGTFGMGYRSRRQGEYCAVLQKQPIKAKGVWKDRSIADIRQWRPDRAAHPHAKPVDLQGDLMVAVSNEGDYVIDPAAGSFSVMEAAKNRGRTFLGCDLEG